MPIYEYYCPTCQKEFELMRPFSEAGAPGKCPTCGAKSEKLVSLFASKENYTIKVPTGSAYRGKEKAAVKAGPTASGRAPTPNATKPKASKTK